MTNINWDGDAESAPFKSRFDDESENLILAETDTGTALFEWDGAAWQFRGPVEMTGEDVSGIGSLTATSGNFDSVTTEGANIDGSDPDSEYVQWYRRGTSGARAHISHQSEQNVAADTPTEILSPGSDRHRGAIIVVVGRNSGSSHWTDLLSFVGAEGVATINSHERGNPGARDYTISDNWNLQLEIATESRVSTQSFHGEVSDPS